MVVGCDEMFLNVVGHVPTFLLAVSKFGSLGSVAVLDVLDKAIQCTVCRR
jgi:hypothetical protein